MCVICIDFIKGKLTQSEALRHLAEMSVILDDSHVEEAEQIIAEGSPERYEES